MSFVGAFRSHVGTGSPILFLAKSCAAYHASVVALDFADFASATVACANISPLSGIPTLSTAWKHAVAKASAPFPARPISSEANITIRLAINFGSSPASTIRAK